MINIEKLCQELEAGRLDTELTRIYGGSAGSQGLRISDAVKTYSRHFSSHDVSVFSSPGRSEIGGNHTDHQNGRVLAAAIDLDILAVAGYTANAIHIISEGHGEFFVPLDNLEADSRDFGTTTALIKGVAAGFLKEGYRIGGFTAYITSSVPSGIGLSSSAAFEMLMGTILSDLYNDGNIPTLELARIGKFAENIFFGKPCGLMDQMACGLGGMVHIDFEEESHPVISPIFADFHTFRHDLCIVHTGGSHANLIEEYAAIPKEMKQVAETLGFRTLRPVTFQMLMKDSAKIRSCCGDRAFLRALHFVLENQRVSAQADCLHRNDFSGFLKLVKQSGESSYKFLQNIYLPSRPSRQNIALALAVSEDFLGDSGVCRVHGGGFAGTIQAWVRKDRTSQYKAYIDGLLGRDACKVLSIRRHGAVKVI